MGSLTYINDKDDFIYYSFVWKFVGGLGSGLNATSSMAIVASYYKQEREKTFGLLESFSGVGLLLGPFFGAILYHIGGYVLPFISI